MKKARPQARAYAQLPPVHVVPCIQKAVAGRSAPRLHTAMEGTSLGPHRHKILLVGPKEAGKAFHHNGRVGVGSNGGLASTAFGMDHMMRTMFEQTSASLTEVVRMASLTPAERIGMDRDIGSLAPGKYADVLILDRDLNVQEVYVGGVPFTFFP